AHQADFEHQEYAIISQSVSLAPKRGSGRIRFPNRHAVQFRPLVGQFGSNLFEKKVCQIFGGRFDFVKRRNLIKERMVKRLQNTSRDSLQITEIYYHTTRSYRFRL